MRAILNYGHTVGHALETVLGYGTLTHGAAVAVGMSVAARLSVRLGMLQPADAKRQDVLLQRLGLPTWALIVSGSPPGRRRPELRAADSDTASSHRLCLEAMLLDKKTVGGRLRFVLARAIGTVKVREVAAEEVLAALQEDGR